MPGAAGATGRAAAAGTAGSASSTSVDMRPRLRRGAAVVLPAARPGYRIDGSAPSPATKEVADAAVPRTTGHTEAALRRIVAAVASAGGVARGQGLSETAPPQSGARAEGSPPPARHPARQPPEQLVASGGAPGQAQPGKIEVHHTDVGMSEQIRLVISGTEQLPRHLSRGQQASDTSGRTTAHEIQHAFAAERLPPR